MKSVFLSGPMRGVPREESLAWRQQAAALLVDKFKVRHALRGRELKERFTDSRAAVIRDLSDIESSDILLVNDTRSDCSMIGTSMEVFFAFERNKPVIVFGDGHSKDYWLNYCTHLRVQTLEEACSVLNDLFSD